MHIWAMDNGAYTGAYPGDDAYLSLLAQLSPHVSRCLFAAAPDVLYDAPATLRLFPKMAGRIQSLGYPVALVGQDGMETQPIPWHSLDWLFMGGSTEWKMSAGARALIREAKTRGKRVHIGRVNSRRRFAYALTLNVDSVDGNYLGFGPNENLPQLLSWLRLHDQTTLPI